jgi:hypothetical protein
MGSKWLVLTAMLTLGGVQDTRRAGPVPGDVFREYTWWNEQGDAGGSLRVGGKESEELPDRGWAHDYIDAPIVLSHRFDLECAIKAEVIVEKILCHDGTKGLALEVNGNPWLTVPEALTIPYPPWEYQHHISPVVPVPLSFLRSGTGNRFRMRVDADHPWKWPQNLIYGVR